MSRVRLGMSTSLDGFAAGPDQDLEHPLGVDGRRLFGWRFVEQLHPTDAHYLGRAQGLARAFVMGRNMFGPVRGPWGDSDWRGWWGEEPPYHCPVFVLTHHPHDPVELAGGTTFHFVTDGIEAAHERASAVAGPDGWVEVGGGASTAQQFLRAGLVDEVQLAISPIVLGAGERLFDHVAEGLPGYTVTESASSPSAVHVVLTRD